MLILKGNSGKSVFIEEYVSKYNSLWIVLNNRILSPYVTYFVSEFNYEEDEIKNLKNIILTKLDLENYEIVVVYSNESEYKINTLLKTIDEIQHLYPSVKFLISCKL